ncbi:MAG TPA: ABC transporter ATP-binding protein [Dehalococcoidia bacterium]|jgi:branched-chain amino acid transport system ATP-binding protein|nr:ABC transporter ATP-binding protein [Dehalococcoidia bacterium]
MLELEAKEIFVAYGDLTALWGVSLEVHQGEIVVLIGPNGAGKTTLMRAIAGLQQPSRGSIVLDGESVHQLRAHQLVGRGVVLIPEGRRLFANMSVLENLMMGAYAQGARAVLNETLDRVFTVFPVLAERREQAAGTLSGGQQQMLAIGRALMSQPRLLMLDEPSLGLAPLVVADIFDVLRQINGDGVTILLAEQNARMALELAHRAYILEEGRVSGEGTAQEMLQADHVRRAYLGQVSPLEGAPGK